MLLLGGMALMPTSMMAKSDYGWDDNAEILVNLNGEEVDYQVIDATQVCKYLFPCQSMAVESLQFK